MEKVYSMQEQMGNVNREMEIQRKHQKKWQRSETLKLNAFDGLISLGMVQESVSDNDRSQKKKKPPKLKKKKRLEKEKQYI